MRFLQVGLGSMGKRRIRCLRALGQTDVLAVDPRPDRREEAERTLGVKTETSLERALERGVDCVLVSTPPDHHLGPLRAALSAGKHCFCEAGIVPAAVDELRALARVAGVVSAPSATLRFHPLYQHLHRLVREERVLGRPLLLTFHLGNYILDWHPWEGLDFYAGRRATGACREMVPFELQWMRWILGPVESVQCTHAKQLDLATDIDDTYAIVARFEGGLIATIMVEVVARYPVRAGQLLSQAGHISWDFDSNRLIHFAADSQAFKQHKAAARGFNIEEMYVAETEAFLRACRGEAPWPHSWEEELELARVLLACERSHETGARVQVRDVSV